MLKQTYTLPVLPPQIDLETVRVLKGLAASMQCIGTLGHRLIKPHPDSDGRELH